MENNIRVSWNKTIRTYHLGATANKGSRIKATNGEHSIVVPYDSAVSGDENHMFACRALLKKLEWEGAWIGGEIRNGYIFVME